METPIHYVLIIANRTAAAPTLLERVRKRAQRSPCEFTLLVPTPPGVPEAEQEARTSMARALPELERVAGGTVRGLMVSAEPLVAVERMLADEHFDEVLVSTLPEPVSSWLKADLPARIERPWLPVAVVNASSDPKAARAAGGRRGRRRPAAATRRRHPGCSEVDRITLRDGFELVLRPVCPQDAKRLAGLVDGLSDEASYRRFLGSKGRLTKAELHYLTEVDHRDHDALLALDPRTGTAVAVARYIRDPRQGDAAEMAVLVGDRWQARGLGKAISSRLAQRARANGIRRFRALTLADNQAALKLIGQLGSTSLVRDGHTMTIEVKLTATPPSGSFRHATPRPDPRSRRTV
jgi:RimJ/RimL family protein N-acetyltransferase